MIAVLAVLAAVAGSANALQNIREPVGEDFMTVRMDPRRLMYLPPPSSEVATVAKTTGTDGDDFPLDSQITMLSGLLNEGEKPINVTGIMGSLNMPEAFQFYYVNFTYKHFGHVVEQGQEMTFAYPFKLQPEDLMMINQRSDESPTTVQMAMTLFYDDGEAEYSTTFFNKTVRFVPGPATMDWAFLLQLGRDIIVGGVILFAVAYGVLGQQVMDALPVGGSATDEADEPASAGAGVGTSSKGGSKKKGGNKKKRGGN
jgi:hypothetical protein